ncbi:MAG: caspase family protein [Rhizobiaceae bacterium]|nr:caspase family protein [Rhizobiaceae bacterium]MCV0408727.1 caspase family protein [Rhizobiaceae bacterium]
MSRNGLLLSLAALCFVAAISAASAERRVALVIGNSNYSELQQLTNPAADAVDMAQTLASIGYEVIRAENLTKDGFRISAQEFLGKIVDAETALLYYAGHAVQVDSVNYLLPVDAVLEQPTDVLFNAVPLQDIVRLMEQRARVSVVLVDACRDNPFGKDALPNGTRGVALEQGLAAENASDGSYLAFAAQPGKPSFDGNGRNSPFTSALIDHIAKPGVDIRLAMADVRESVAEATGYRQIPWESSSLVGRFTLNPNAPGPGLVILPAEPKDQIAEEPAVASAPVPPGPARTDESIASAAEEIAATDAGTDPAGPAPANGETAPQQTAAPAEPAPVEEETVEQASLAPAPATEPVEEIDPDRLVTLVQEELIRIGCLAGSADGAWGPKSRAALQQWSSRREVKIDRNEPTSEALAILRGERGRICPAVAAPAAPARTSSAPSRPAPAKAAPPAKKQAAPKQPKQKGYFGWQPGGSGVQFCTTCPDS